MPVFPHDHCVYGAGFGTPFIAKAEGHHAAWRNIGLCTNFPRFIPFARVREGALRPWAKRLLWGVLPTVFWACLCFQLIRLHLLERYLVASGSMEPTLHGDPLDGDRVLVDKTAFWSQDPEAFDLVVLRSQEPGENHLVKRFIAQGPCRISLREGDVFISRAGPMDPLVKDPRQRRDMRVSAFEFVAGLSPSLAPQWLHPAPQVWALEPDGLRLQASADPEAALRPAAQRQRRARRPPDDFLPGFLSLAQSVDTSFLNLQGKRLSSASSYPRDIGMELHLVLEADCEELFLVLEHRGRYYQLAYETAGEGRLSLPSGEELLFKGPPLRKGSDEFLSFGYLDGHFFLEIAAGNLPLHHEHPLPSEFDPSDLGMPGEAHLANLMHIGSRGGGLLIRGMRVFHDVYYQPSPDRVFELAPGEIFLLGDNSLQSSDSRSLVSTSAKQGYHFRRQDLIGRPIAVIGPWAAMRWLSP